MRTSAPRLRPINNNAAINTAAAMAAQSTAMGTIGANAIS